MKLYLASGNAHKVEEFRRLAAAVGPALQIASAAEVGGMPAVVEDAGTFEGNALKKVRALAVRIPAGCWALADDSGLCVDALGGAPGVESAYYAGPQADPAANLTKLVEAVRAEPPGRRGAHFRCVLALVDPSGRESLHTGRCSGALAQEPRGGRGFGYDPLFVPDGHAESFAELPADVKDRIGHRGRAWAALVLGLGWAEGRTRA